MSKSNSRIPYYTSNSIRETLYLANSDMFTKNKLLEKQFKELEPHISNLQKLRNLAYYLDNLVAINDVLSFKSSDDTIHAEGILDIFTTYMMLQYERGGIHATDIPTQPPVNKQPIVIRLGVSTTAEFNSAVSEYAINKEKVYLTKLKSLSTKNFEQLQAKYHTDKFILQPFSGFAYDTAEDMFIISQDLMRTTRSETTLKDLWFFLPKPLIPFDTLKQGIRNIVDNFVNELIKPLEVLRMWELEVKLHNIKVDATKREYDQIERDIQRYLEQLRANSRKQEQLSSVLYALENKEISFELSKVVNILKKQQCVEQAKFEGDNTLELWWLPMPITFFDEERLKKSIEFLVSRDDTQRKEALQKVISGEYFLYTLGFRTIIDVNTFYILHKKREYNNSLSGFYNERRFYNKHPLHNEGRGCYGSFLVPLEEAKRKCDWRGILMLLKQFYQSITINDPLGDDAVRYLTICDASGNIVQSRYASFIGKNIIELAKQEGKSIGINYEY